MRISDDGRTRRRTVGVWVAALAFCASGDGRAASAVSPEDGYLDQLQGAWVMDGTLGGKPVRYIVEGGRVLQGGFLLLHMLDVNLPPQYESDLFLGFDPKTHDYVAHWLDRFGAAGARVVATGERHGQQLVLVFPYAEGAMRDTFTWQPASRSWSLLLESQRKDGAWTTFASYSLTRERLQ